MHEKKKTVYGRRFLPDIETEIILLKPMTFSNLSTEAVLYVASFLKVLQEDVFVVYDDINTDLGECFFNPPRDRVFHNGVKNLIEFFMDDDFVKCGVGIGPLPSTVNEEDYYLSDFNGGELSILRSVFEKVELLVNNFIAVEKSSQPIELP
uniref:Peptidyl-tRNA hydrolase n=1 Tax=Magallana gigas TaxID=29159 RepID=K1PW65_MAGGI